MEACDQETETVPYVLSLFSFNENQIKGSFETMRTLSCRNGKRRVFT